MENLEGDEMKKRTLWNDEHEGIRFEIQRFQSLFPKETQYSWCHYIYLWSQMFKEGELKKPVVYYTSFGTRLSVSPNSFLDNCDFHGGITFYNMEAEHEDGFLIKVGCDYQHYWDMGQEYSLEYIRSEAIASCISIIKSEQYLMPMDVWVNETLRPRFPGKETNHHRFNYLGHPLNKDQTE